MVWKTYNSKEEMKSEYLIKNKEKLVEELLKRFRFISTDETENEFEGVLIYDNRVKGFYNKWRGKEFIFQIHQKKEEWYVSQIEISNNLTLKEFKEILEVLENYIEEKND